MDPGRRLRTAKQAADSWLGPHPRIQAGFDIARRVAREQSRERLSLSAAAVAFWVVIAITPTFIAIVMIFGRLVDPDDLAKAVADIRETAPDTLGSLVATQVQTAADANVSAASWSIALSLITVLWAVSTGVYTFARAIRFAYGLPPQAYVVARARAFGGGVIAVLFLGILVFATAIVTAWASTAEAILRPLIYAAVGIVGLTLMTAVLIANFRFAVGHVLPRPLYLPGALIGAVGTLGAFIGFGIYLQYATSYQAIYGTLASSVILSLVVYVTNYIILIGAVTNAQIRPATPAAASPASH